MLYVITDDATSHVETAKKALTAGVRLIQFRSKKLSLREQLKIVCQLKELTEAYQAFLIVNDRLDLALAANADGVHLGETDLPVKEARKLAPKSFLIGASAGSISAAQKAQQEGADYLGVGPVFKTPTKPDAGQPLGLSQLSFICHSVQIPVFAIGGINKDNVSQVMATGVTGIAAVSAALALAKALPLEKIKGETAWISRRLSQR